MRSGLAFCLVVLLAGCGLDAFGTAPSDPSLAAASAPATPTATPSVAMRPGPTATASVAPLPTPTPVPTPDPAAMDLEVTSCNGGVVLRWSPSAHDAFHHYIGLRSPEREIAPDYPPIAPAVDWGDLYATDRFITTGFDATVVPSSTVWNYRVVAYDAAGRVVSRSDVERARILSHRSLGPLSAEVLDDGRVRVSWRPFAGVPECFSAYRVLQGTGGVATTLLSSISDPQRVELETDALRPGTTYTLRVQAVHTTALGHFVLGESDVLTLTISAE